MPDNKGHLLPVYVVADGSYLIKPYAGELNSGMTSLFLVLRSEPMVAARVPRSVLGCSDNGRVRVPPAGGPGRAPAVISAGGGCGTDAAAPTRAPGPGAPARARRYSFSSTMAGPSAAQPAIAVNDRAPATTAAASASTAATG